MGMSALSGANDGRAGVIRLGIERTVHLQFVRNCAKVRGFPGLCEITYSHDF
jgi:hypothetical protein